MYWHDPDPGAFAAISPALGSLGVREVVSERGTSLLLRDSPLLTGVAREDLIYQITTSGWNQSSVPDVHASNCQFIGRPINPTDITPIDLSKAVLTSAVLSPTGLTLQSTGVADFVVRAAAAGQYPLYITAVAGRSDTSALIRVDVSGIQSSWLPVPGVVSGPALDLVPLIAGSNHVTLTVQNAGDSDTCQIAAIALGSEAQYPSGAQILAAPGALVAWKHGGGLVVLDGTEWDSNANNTLRGARFASALLSDVGFGFASAAAGSSSQSIPLSAFSLNGVSPYFSQTNDRISFYNDGDVETKVRFAQSGRYDFRVYGYSSPFHGVYALAQVSIDGKSVGDVELKSATAQWFEIDSIPVVTGEHSIGFSFINDQSDATEDRNMFVQGFAVAAAAGNQ